MSQPRMANKGVLPIELVIKKTKRAISRAQNDYEKWSQFWLWQAPEYMLTMYIAREIATIHDYTFYLTLENSVRGAMEDAGGKKTGRPPEALRQHGRMDILLWRANDTPRAVIEVKNGVDGFSPLKDDVNRICSILKKEKGNKFQCGLVAFYSSCRGLKSKNAKTRLEERLESLKDDGRNLVRNEELKLKTHRGRITVDEDDSAWVAAVWEITRG